MTEIYIVLGVLVLSFALRTVRWALCRKIGMIGFFVATFLSGYLLFGHWWQGAGLLALWFILPWIDLLTRARQMRLPLERKLAQKPPPNSSKFPELTKLTEDLEAEGFEWVADRGWDWHELHQFFRILYHPEKKVEATICFSEQNHLSWADVKFTSKSALGHIYRTVNVPFSTPMRAMPHVHIRRDVDSESMTAYLVGHLNWIKELGYTEATLKDQSVDCLVDEIVSESGQQISHNLKAGILTLCQADDETWRYSWRGLCYLYCQLIKDFVRFC